MLFGLRVLLEHRHRDSVFLDVVATAIGKGERERFLLCMENILLSYGDTYLSPNSRITVGG